MSHTIHSWLGVFACLFWGEISLGQPSCELWALLIILPQPFQTVGTIAVHHTWLWNFAWLCFGVRNCYWWDSSKKHFWCRRELPIHWPWMTGEGLAGTGLPKRKLYILAHCWVDALASIFRWLKYVSVQSPQWANPLPWVFSWVPKSTSSLSCPNQDQHLPFLLTPAWRERPPSSIDHSI